MLQMYFKIYKILKRVYYRFYLINTSISSPFPFSTLLKKMKSSIKDFFSKCDQVTCGFCQKTYQKTSFFCSAHYSQGSKTYLEPITSPKHLRSKILLRWSFFGKVLHGYASELTLICCGSS